MKRLKHKQMLSIFLAGTLLCTNLFSTVSYAKDGWTPTLATKQNEIAAREYTFSAAANQQAEAAGVVPTGLSLDYTFCYHQETNPAKGYVKPHTEPYAHGKWWLGNHRGEAKFGKVPLASNPTIKVGIDFSEMSNRFISCIDAHNGSGPGVALPGQSGKTYDETYSGQFFCRRGVCPDQ